MGLLVRKISKAKWQTGAIEGRSPVSADAITCDLRTKENRLSVWLVANTDELDEAVLALTSQHQELDTIDVAALDEQSILESGLAVEQKAGLTPVADLRDCHRDITSLNYNTLGNVAQAVVSSFLLNRVERYTGRKIAEIILKAITDGRLDPQKLDQGFLAKVRSTLARAQQ
jgi:hypothetical protein